MNSEKSTPNWAQTVQVAGAAVRWPWICACCGATMESPPSDAKPLGTSDVFEVAKSTRDFFPTYCDRCFKHVNYTGAAYRARPVEQASCDNALLGIIASPFIAFGVFLIVALIAWSIWYGLIAGALASAACWIAGIKADQKHGIKIVDDRQRADLEAKQNLDRAAQLLDASCTCETKAVEVKRVGETCTFSFTHPELAFAFGKLNQDKIIQ